MARGVRNAPSFLPSNLLEDKPYTAVIIGRFLGWLESDDEPQAKVHNALAALQFIEEGILDEAAFDGLTTMQAAAVVEQTRKAKAAQETAARLERKQAEEAERAAREAEKARERAEQKRRKRQEQAARARNDELRRRREQEARDAERAAREAERQRKQAEQRSKQARGREQEARKKGRQQASNVGRGVSDAMRSGKAGYKQAGQVASDLRTKKDGPPPEIDDFARRLCRELNKILDPDRDQRAQGLDALVRFQSNMRAQSLRELIAELDGITRRANHYRDKLLAPDKTEERDVVTLESPDALEGEN